MRSWMFPALLALVSGCVASAPKKVAAPSPPPRVQTAAEAKAQQQAYDRGLAAFGKEDYVSARKAFAEAVRLGPATPLGRRAKENLQKVESILKNLRELDKP